MFVNRVAELDLLKKRFAASGKAEFFVLVVHVYNSESVRKLVEP